MNGQILAAIAALAAKLTAKEMSMFETCAIGEGQRAGLIPGTVGSYKGFYSAASACGITHLDAIKLYTGGFFREDDGSVVVARTRHFLDRVVAMG